MDPSIAWHIGIQPLTCDFSCDVDHLRTDFAPIACVGVMPVRRKRPPSWRALLFRVAGMFYCCSDFAYIGVMAITVKSFKNGRMT